jgi:hypothetical protein
MVTNSKLLNKEANSLAEQLFGEDFKKRTSFTNQLLDICAKASDKDFLLIHNPGGWGSTRLEELLQWERSVVEGITAAVKGQGYNSALIQYFRSDHGFRAVIEDVREEARFFVRKSTVMAAELEFVTRHFENLEIILIGVSQGAAFSNAVMQHLNEQHHVVSIEMGLPFYYRSRRVITERTLALDSNGDMPDDLMDLNVPVILITYFTAPFRWLKHRIHGKKLKFSYCINVPGHNYDWQYPEVHRRIENFLVNKFGVKH